MAEKVTWREMERVPVWAVKEFNRLSERCEALEKMCAAYRLGKRPSEKVLRTLDRTKEPTE